MDAGAGLGAGVSQLTFLVTNLLQPPASGANVSTALNTTEASLAQGLWDVEPRTTPRHGLVPATEAGSTVPAFGYRAFVDPSVTPAPSPDNPQGFGVLNGSLTFARVGAPRESSYCRLDFEMIEHATRKLTVTRTRDLQYALFNTIVASEMIYQVVITDSAPTDH